MRGSIFLLLFLAVSAQADPTFHGTGGTLNVPVPINERIGYDQKTGAAVPGDLPFVDENGKTVPLGSYFGHGPTVLALVYYGCPNLCTLTINGLFKAMGDVTLTTGKDYSVVVVSIDPTEGPKLAAEKRRAVLRGYGRDPGGTGIHFLTGKKPEIDHLAQAVGFRYVYDAAHQQYAHPAGLVLVTPNGKISRYLFGVDFPPQNLRLGLVEAGERKISRPIDAFLLYCYHYDPATGTYTLLIQRLLSAAAGLTAGGIAVAIFLMVRAEGAGGVRA